MTTTMKLALASVALPVSVIAFAMPAAAGNKNGETQNGSTNGQPFQALQAQIDANKQAIAGNAADIATLAQSINDVAGDVSNLQSDLSDLEFLVAGNAADIAALMARVDTTENDISDLADGLADLEAKHDSDYNSLASRISAAEARLVELNDLREQLAADLALQLAGLQAAIDSNTFAIDSVVLQVVTINAQLSTINSSILTMQMDLAALQAAQAANASAISDLQGLVSGLQGDVDTLYSYHTTLFSGIRTNVDQASLNGWSECYSTLYSDRNAHPEAMYAACTGDKIMLACRQTGSSTLTVAAYAGRDDVFRDTGGGYNNPNVTNANGVDWYFSWNYSMGFAPQGAGITLSSADVQDRSDPLRLSWHTHDYGVGGWRCGGNTSLNNSSAWEKVILQAD